MIRDTIHLRGLKIQASDGEIGSVEEFYFDDDAWAIRYLVVDTGGWLGGRRVLISPISVIPAGWGEKRLAVALTKTQVESSPDIDTYLPVSRQHEAAYMEHYGYPSYWAGVSMWGPGFYPGALLTPKHDSAKAGAVHAGDTPEDSHLRSSEAVKGYHVAAADGEIGHVAGYLADEETWAIRYIEVATRNWLPGKKVLVSPGWVDAVNWLDSKVTTTLTREVIESAPEYSESMSITRGYEERLYSQYGRPPYWARGV